MTVRLAPMIGWVLAVALGVGVIPGAWADAPAHHRHHHHRYYHGHPVHHPHHKHHQHHKHHRAAMKGAKRHVGIGITATWQPYSYP